MVVTGNPPYSYESANKSWMIDENGKKVPNFIGRLIKDYYEVDGKPLGEKNPKGLQDDYVKFIRFGQHRIEKTGSGILALITNHSYLDNPTFRGMRQSLMKSFDEIYILDLHGNSKKKETCPDGSKDVNVFDIQQGVAITLFVKSTNESKPAVVYHSDLYGNRIDKYNWLLKNDIVSSKWTEVKPCKPLFLFFKQDEARLKEYKNIPTLNDLFTQNAVGIATARDDLTIHYNQTSLYDTIKSFVSLDIEKARNVFNLGKDTRDWKIELAQNDLKDSGLKKDNIIQILYRPFDFRYTYYTGKTKGFHSMPRYIQISHMLFKNLALFIGRQGQVIGSDEWDLIYCGDNIEDYNLFRRGNNACFPLYLYKEENKEDLFDNSIWPSGENGRVPNLNKEFVDEFASKVKLDFISDGTGDLTKTFGPEDLFHYIYAILHSPEYRNRYAEFLKIDFPRIPIPSSKALFENLCKVGSKLTGLHLMESNILEDEKRLPAFNIEGSCLVDSGYPSYIANGDNPQKGKVYINKDQYFEGVSPEVWEFHIGGYQVCEKWLKDRRQRNLSVDDIRHYEKVTVALKETISLMNQIDEVINNHGGWPIK